MSHDEALEALASHPHARRWRELCADGSDPERRDAWRAQVVRIALGLPIGGPRVAVDYGAAAAAPPARCCNG